MYQGGNIYLGKSGDEKVFLNLSMANRHGMIAGATGTGKTVTLKVLAESFSDAGVPVFLSDVKGDLSGMCQPGVETEDVSSRLDALGAREDGFSFKSYPTQYWDVYGESGLPLRTTVSEMGPLLLARILQLNDTQEGVLTAIFRIADDEGLLLIDSKDLRSMLSYVSEHAKEYSVRYGNMAKQSISAILRSVLALEDQGGDQFLGEPALNISDWLCTDADGRGMVNVLDCRKLILNPTMYATFLLWMLSELYETLPEVGDCPKPKMAFFFDEAHLLFDMASKELLQKIGQVVRLIRSKGVGIYFITQNPSDIPEDILSQLGNKVQHALHAYTPSEQRSIKAAADSFRVNPAFDTAQALQNLGIGQALVSVLDSQGIPTIVKQVRILPPQSQMGVLDDAVRDSQIKGSLLYSRYAEMIDRDSAYEFLERMHLADEEKEKKAQEEAQRKKEEAAAAREQARLDAAAQKEQQKQAIAAEKAAQKEKARQEAAAQKQQEKEEKQRKQAVRSVLSSASGTVGRQVGKTVGNALGGSFGRTLGGNVGASLGRGILKTLFRS